MNRFCLSATEPATEPSTEPVTQPTTVELQHSLYNFELPNVMNQVCVVVWLVMGTKKKVSGPPLCPIWLTKGRTDCPRSVIYRQFFVTVTNQ